jgi:photosystem II stability/assembly factor-like uncharacterized protein
MRHALSLLLALLPLAAHAQSYAWRDVTPDSLRGTPCATVALAHAPTGPRVIYAVCRPGLLRSDDGGASWTLVRRNLIRLAVPFRFPDRVYAIARGWTSAGRNDTLLISRDGAQTWQALPGSFKHTPVVSPFDPDRFALVASHAGMLYTTLDAGQTFRTLEFPFDSHDGNVLTVASSLKERDKLLVHALSFYPYDRSWGAEALFKTEGWGRTWGSFVPHTGRAGGCEFCLLTDTTGAVYMGERRSQDEGRTWQTLRSGDETISARASSPVNAIAYAASNPAPYVGERYHLSGDNGRTWRPVAFAPRAVVGDASSFKLDPADSTLFVASSRGLFALARQTGTAAGSPPARDERRLIAYPNPFHERLTVEASGLRSGHARAEVFDLLGRPVARLSPDARGDARFVWEPGEAPPGVYVVRLTDGVHTLTQPVVHRAR